MFAHLIRSGALEAALGDVVAHLCSTSPVQANLNVVVNNLIAGLCHNGLIIFRPPGAPPVDEGIAKHLPSIHDAPGFYEGVGYFAEKLRSVLNAARDRDVTFLIDGLDGLPGSE